MAATAMCVVAVLPGLAALAGAVPEAAWIVAFAGTGTAGSTGDAGPALAAQLVDPVGLAEHVDGLLVADEGANVVRRIAPDGTISTIAGTGVAGHDGDGGAAVDARLAGPRDVAARPSGAVYVADTGNHVVRLVEDGTIRTVAGTGVAGADGDGGPATAARLSSPSGLAVRPNGHLVIADTGNHRIREVALDGTITTLAGGTGPGDGGDGGPATAAALDWPTGVAVLANGTVLIADTGNDRIRRVDVHGTITTVAGTGRPGRDGDGGPATSASLRGPEDVQVADDGTVLIADTGNHLVRQVTAGGDLVTLAGAGQPGDDGDGGAAAVARLRSPRGVVDAVGGSVLADTGNHRLRQLVPPLPTPALTGVVPAGPANDNDPRVVGSAPPGTTVEVFDGPGCDGPVLAVGTAADLAAGLVAHVPDDSVTVFHARATDRTGASSACSTSSVTFQEDSTAPPSPTLTARPASPSSAAGLTWAFDAGAHATVCTLTGPDGAVVRTEPCTSPWSTSVAGGPDGTYGIAVRAVDEAGNTSAPAVTTHVVDTIPPAAPDVRLQPVEEGFAERPLWRLQAGPGETMTCRFGGTGQGWTDWSSCASPWSRWIDPTVAAVWVLEARATDLAGNTGPVASSRYTLGVTPEATVDPAPTVDPVVDPVEPVWEPDPTAPAPVPTPAPPDGVPSPGPSATPVVTERQPTDEVGTAGAARDQEGEAIAPPARGGTSGGQGAPGTPAAPPRGLAAPAAPPAPPPGLARPAGGGLGEAILATASRTGQVLVRNADNAAFPMALLLLVLGYLALQDRIDGRDPKLARAPLAEPELAFPAHAQPTPQALPSCWVSRHPPTGRSS